MNVRGAAWVIGGVALAIGAATFYVVQRGRAVTSGLEALRAEEEELLSAAARTSLAEHGSRSTSRQDADLAKRSPEETPGAASSRRVAAAREHIRVHIRGPDGKPISGAALATFRNESVLDSAFSDVAGVVNLKAGDGVAQYALLAPGWALERGELELASPEHTLDLEDRLTIAGRVSVDGALPKRSLELAFDGGIPALPTEVFNALGGARRGRLSMQARTERDGTFAFRGLKSPESGTIHWEEPYFLVARAGFDGARFTQASTSEERLRLELVEGLELRLRVVDPAGVPVPGAFVEVKVVPERRRDWRELGAVADAEGRYTKALLPGESSACVVEVALYGGRGARVHTLAWPTERRGVFDAGDLVTGPVDPIQVVVQDEHGAPVEGARVLAWPPGQWPHRTTDAEGRTAVELEFGQHELEVQAEEFVEEVIAVPADTPELVVRLKRPAILELEILGPRRQRSLTVQLSGLDPLFVRDSRRMRRERSSDGSEDSIQDADGEGRWKFVGLTPHQPLSASLLGSDGLLLSTIEIAPLSPGERRVVPWSLADEDGSLRVRVVGPDGRPLPAARVTLSLTQARNDARRDGTPVDANGEVEFPSLYGTGFTLLAEAAGFGAQALLVPSNRREPIEIALDEAHAIEVELVSPRGKAVDEGHDVVALLGGMSAGRVERVGLGRYRIEGLPRQQVRLFVSGPRGEASALHDATRPVARIVLGEPGGIFASLYLPERGFESRWAVSIAAPGDAADLDRQEFRSSDRTEAIAGISGLPLGTWDVWLEKGGEGDPSVWERVGTPQSVKLDAREPNAVLEFQP